MNIGNLYHYLKDEVNNPLSYVNNSPSQFEDSTHALYQYLRKQTEEDINQRNYLDAQKRLELENLSIRRQVFIDEINELNNGLLEFCSAKLKELEVLKQKQSLLANEQQLNKSEIYEKLKYIFTLANALKTSIDNKYESWFNLISRINIECAEKFKITTDDDKAYKLLNSELEKFWVSYMEFFNDAEEIHFKVGKVQEKIDFIHNMSFPGEIEIDDKSRMDYSQKAINLLRIQRNIEKLNFLDGIIERYNKIIGQFKETNFEEDSNDTRDIGDRISIQLLKKKYGYYDNKQNKSKFKENENQIFSRTGLSDYFTNNSVIDKEFKRTKNSRIEKSMEYEYK